jgi:thiol-disulfide isomerase/thioredoxin
MLSAHDGGGVELRAVFPGSPAATAGFGRGDVIVRLNDEVIDSTQEFVGLVGALGSGTTAGFWREGATEATSVTLGALPPDFEQPITLLGGQDLPDVAITALDGTTPVAIPDGTGRPTLLDFWATWCGPCVRAIPELRALRSRYSDDQLAIVSISDEPASDVSSFLTQQSMPWTVAIDAIREANDVYWITSYPTLVLLDGSGRIVEVAAGANGIERIETALQSLLSSP